MPSSLFQTFFKRSKRSKRRSSSPSRSPRTRAFPVPRTEAEESDFAPVESPHPVPERASTVSRSKSFLRPFGLDSRSNSSPASAPARSNTQHVPQRRQSRRSTSFPSRQALPRLEVDLGRGGDGEGEPGGLGLGLDQLGKWPKLSEAEVRQQDTREIGLSEALRIWETFLPALRHCDFSRAALGGALDDAGDFDYQRYVLALMLATFDPPNHFRAPPSAAFRNHGSFSYGERPIQRLQTLLAEPHQDVIDFLSVLFWSLRHLKQQHQPVITPTVYEALASSEPAATAYNDILVARLDNTTSALLNAVLEVCASVAAHGEENGLYGSRFCFMLGFWLFDNRPQGESWEELQQRWLIAGERMEKVFLAWLRSEAWTRTLPGRLLKLIDPNTPATPLGTASDSATVLQISLTRKNGTLPQTSGSDVMRILREVDHAALPTIAPALSGILEEVGARSGINEQKRSSSFRSDSLTVASESPLTPFDGFTNYVSSPVSDAGMELLDARRPDQANRRSRSFGDFGYHTMPRINGRTTSPKAGDWLSPQRDLSPLDRGGDVPLTAKRYSTWEEVSEFGFGDVSSDLARLQLDRRQTELPPARAPTTLPIKRPNAVQALMSSPSAIPQTPTYRVESERVIGLDPLFLRFLQNQSRGQNAREGHPFALHVLKQSAAHADAGACPIQALLITVRDLPPAPLPVPAVWRVRPTSPSGRSTMSRPGSTFSIRGLLERSRSSGMLGSVRTSSMRRRPDLPSSGSSFFSARPRPRLQDLTGQQSMRSAATNTETIPSIRRGVSDTAEDSSTSVDMPGSSTSVPDRLTIQPREWYFKAEGGQHAIFGNRSLEPEFRGKVLRVRKGEPLSPAQEELQAFWRDEKLPAMIDSRLLPGRQRLKVHLSTLTQLWSQESRRRSVERLAGLGLVLESSDVSEVWVDLLDDVTQLPDAAHYLSVEIKPKWGFLPKPGDIHEPERQPARLHMSRYRAHQMLKQSGATYEPLDLFSEDDHRQRKAMRCLWSDWRDKDIKSNNLSLSVNGQPVLPGDARYPWLDDAAFREEVLSPSVLASLARTRVLPTLRELQHGPDISLLAHELRSSTEAHEEPQNWNPFVDYDFGTLTKDDLDRSPVGGLDFRQKVVALSKAAVFKDCSIVVCLPFDMRSDGSIQLRERESRTSVIDLDLKDTQSKLAGWYDLDRKIWEPHSIPGLSGDDVKGSGEHAGAA